MDNFWLLAATVDNVTNPEIAEASAIRLAILFAKEQSFNRVIIASDCSAVIQNLKD